MSLVLFLIYLVKLFSLNKEGKDLVDLCTQDLFLKELVKKNANFD